MEQPGSHWTGLDEIWYLRIFRKSVKQIRISLKFYRNKGYFIWRLYTFTVISCWKLRRMGNISYRNFRKNKTHFVFNNFFFRKTCRLWDNVEKYGRTRKVTSDKRRGTVTIRLARQIIKARIQTTCHTQYTWDRSIYVPLVNRTTLQVFVTYLTGALYVHPLWFYKHQHDNRVRSRLSVACQRWWFQWLYWFVPSDPGYMWEEEKHKPDPCRNPIERNHMGLHFENEVAVVKTPTIISNNPIQVIHKRMVRFQKLTRSLFLTLHEHKAHRQQQQLSKF